MEHLRDCSVLFFDPDNGIEVVSVQVGKRNSSKYIYWREIEDAYQKGHSVLVYQHFQRKERSQFIAGIAREVSERLEGF